ncbi:MAG: hypothetical protein ABFC96_16520 [Thermoguttaceae bacterium]
MRTISGRQSAVGSWQSPFGTCHTERPAETPRPRRAGPGGRPGVSLAGSSRPPRTDGRRLLASGAILASGAMPAWNA